MKKKNSLLIVDDDASNLMELANILKPEYTIYAVKDGRPALNKAHEAKPDLILLDVIMPGMNGFEVLAELKRSDVTRDIPVIFISGVGDSESESEGFSIGAVDYIRKPFDPTVVKHRVRVQIHILNLQRDLESAALIAKAANESKSQFLANMSHEIRTPMNAIMGITNVLLQNKERTADEVADGLGRINASSEMLLNLINDILDFSKIEAGKLDILPTKYRIANMINDTVQLYLMRIDLKPIEFVLEIDDTIPANLVGDELRIKQILNNLLSNAFKYTESGKVTLSFNYEYGLDDNAFTLIISVKDTGYGMSKAQLDVLFDEYTRFDETAHRSIEGTGLGFPIMRRLVDLMDGDVDVESEPGVGTTVTIQLPQGTTDANKLGKKSADDLRQFKHIKLGSKSTDELIREPMPYGSVLIVDDTDTNLFVAVRFMEPYKLTLETAVTGLEALEKIQNGNSYDVIFMDHMMPEMDGIEATKHIRALGYNRPIVALTANAMAGQAEMFLQNGFDEFISKPIDIRQLDSVLVKLIRDKQPKEVLEAAKKQMDSREEKSSKLVFPDNDPMLMQSFKNDIKKAAEILDKTCEKPGWFNDPDLLKRYTTAVHGLKSIFGCIGEKDLSDLSAKLEDGGRDNDTTLLENETPGFIASLHAIQKELEENGSAGVPGEGITGGGVGNAELLLEKFNKIIGMCEDYDRKGVMEEIASLDISSGEIKSAAEKIREFVVHSEFEEALGIAASFAGKLKESAESVPAPVSMFDSKAVEGLDIARGLERYDGAGHIYIKALRSYAASTRVMLEQIEAFSGDGLNEYKIKVHGIKGASYDINARGVGQNAEDLEEAANRGDLDFINKNHPEFLKSAFKFIGDIDAMIAEIESEHPKEKRNKPEEVLLAKLIIACRDYSMDDVDSLLTQLEKYQYETNGELIVRLRRHADLMQFPKIIELLSEAD